MKLSSWFSLQQTLQPGKWIGEVESKFLTLETQVSQDEQVNFSLIAQSILCDSLQG